MQLVDRVVWESKLVNRLMRMHWHVVHVTHHHHHHLWIHHHHPWVLMIPILLLLIWVPIVLLRDKNQYREH